MRSRALDDSGASSVEYGLIAVAIAAAVTVIVVAFGGAVEGLFRHTCDTINGQAVTGSCAS